MTDLATNVLYYGDNLDILRRYLPDAAVDLVYLDPPNATDAQLLAFEDT
jgi:site-specific DNA-methyltransferase (adenine-specific)